MPTPYSTPSFPAPPRPTPISNTNKIHKAPIYNPYDKFSQVEFDDWIGGITGALRRALGDEDVLGGSAPSDIGAPLPDNDSEVVMEDANGTEDDSELGQDSFAEVRSRRDKGKARDPREGPGLGGRNQPIELLYSDSESGSENASRRGVIGDEGEYEDDERQGYDSAEYDSDGNRYASDDDEFERSEEGEEEYDLNQPSSHRLHREGDEDEDVEEIIELSGGEESVDGYDEYDTRSSPPMLDDEAPDTHERYSPQLDELEEEEEDGVEDDAEFDDEQDQYFATASAIRGSSPPQEIEDDEQIIEEDGQYEQDFPPHEKSPQPVDLVDPWIGPQSYAEDFYNGGDVREGVLDPTIISSSTMELDQDTNVLESSEVIEVDDATLDPVDLLPSETVQGVLDSPTPFVSSEMELGLLDSSSMKVVPDQEMGMPAVEVDDREQSHEVIEVGDGSDVPEEKEQQEFGGEDEGESDHVPIFAMPMSTPTPEELLYPETLEGDVIDQNQDQGGAVVESQTETRSVGLVDNIAADVDALGDIEELVYVDALGDIEELGDVDVGEPAEVHALDIDALGDVEETAEVHALDADIIGVVEPAEAHALDADILGDVEEPADVHALDVDALGDVEELAEAHTLDGDILGDVKEPAEVHALDVDALGDVEEPAEVHALNVDAIEDVEEPAEAHNLEDIGESVAQKETEDQSATRSDDTHHEVLKFESDGLSRDVIMEGTDQSDPKVTVADDNTLSGQIDSEPTMSKDAPEVQLDEVSGGDILDVSMVEQGDYEQEFPPPYQVSSQPIDLVDPWVGPETYAEDFFNGGDVREGVLDPTIVPPSPSGISPEPEREHTWHDEPKFLPSSPLTIDAESDEDEKDEDLLTSSPPQGDVDVDADAEGEDDGTEGGPTYEDELDQFLEDGGGAPVERQSNTESQPPTPEERDSLILEPTVPPVDEVRSSANPQVDWNFPPAFPEGILTSAPGHIAKSSSPMSGVEALDRADEVDGTQGELIPSAESQTEAIAALVHEDNDQEDDNNDDEVAEAAEVENLTSEDEDGALHKGGDFSSELTIESLHEEDESEPSVEVPIAVDSNTGQDDTPQEIHEVPAGVLSGAEMLAEFLTDAVDTPPDNNANEEPTEDEGGADSREESSPEGSLYEGEQEPEDEDDEDHEQIADKHEKLDRLKKMRKPKASKRHEPIPQNPAEKKVKPLPLSEDQRNVLLAFVAQEPFPSKTQREEVAQQLGISARRVQIWFQNYRVRSGKKKTISLHPASDPQPSANPGAPTAIGNQQEEAAIALLPAPAAAHETVGDDISSDLTAGAEVTHNSLSPTTGDPTFEVKPAAITSHDKITYKSAEIEDDPFKLMGSSSLVAPGAVRDTATSADYPPTHQLRDDTLARARDGEAEVPSEHDTSIVAANDFYKSGISTRRTSGRRTSSRQEKVENKQRSAPKRKRSPASSVPARLTRTKSTKSSAGTQSPSISRKGKSKALVQDEEDDRLQGRAADSGSENESDSSGASATSKMLIASGSSSRASSVASNGASVEESTTAYSVPQSPTVSRWRDPLRAPTLFHNHSGLIQFDRSGNPTGLSQGGSLSQPRNTPGSSSNIMPSNPSQRAAPTSNSPVTRSMCRFHRISLPRYEDGPRIFFILPGCSLGNRTLMKEEDIVDHGDATTLDHEVMIGDIESLEFSADPNDPLPLSQSASAELVGVLRQLVGVDLLRENEVFYLPQPGETCRRKRHGKSKSLVNKLSYSEITSPSTATSLRASKSSPSIVRPPPSAAGSTSTTTDSTRSRGMASTSSSAIFHDDDAKVDAEDSGASSSHHTKTKAKKKGSRRQTGKRSTKMSVDFQEYDPVEEENQSTDHEEGETRRGKRRQGVKRSWTESNGGEVPLPPGKRRLRARPSAP